MTMRSHCCSTCLSSGCTGECCCDDKFVLRLMSAIRLRSCVHTLVDTAQLSWTMTMSWIVTISWQCPWWWIPSQSRSSDPWARSLLANRSYNSFNLCFNVVGNILCLLSNRFTHVFLWWWLNCIWPLPGLNFSSEAESAGNSLMG